MQQKNSGPGLYRHGARTQAHLLAERFFVSATPFFTGLNGLFEPRLGTYESTNRPFLGLVLGTLDRLGRPRGPLNSHSIESLDGQRYKLGTKGVFETGK